MFKILGKNVLLGGWMLVITLLTLGFASSVSATTLSSNDYLVSTDFTYQDGSPIPNQAQLHFDESYQNRWTIALADGAPVQAGDQISLNVPIGLFAVQDTTVDLVDHLTQRVVGQAEIIASTGQVILTYNEVYQHQTTQRESHLTVAVVLNVQQVPKNTDYAIHFYDGKSVTVNVPDTGVGASETFVYDAWGHATTDGSQLIWWEVYTNIGSVGLSATVNNLLGPGHVLADGVPAEVYLLPADMVLSRLNLQQGLPLGSYGVSQWGNQLSVNTGALVQPYLLRFATQVIDLTQASYALESSVFVSDGRTASDVPTVTLSQDPLVSTPTQVPEVSPTPALDVVTAEAEASNMPVQTEEILPTPVSTQPVAEVSPTPVASHQIAGQTFIDANHNGIKEASDPVFPQIAVDLLDEQGQVLAKVVSDAQGAYHFDGLAAAKDYIVRFNLPPQYQAPVNQVAGYGFTMTTNEAGAQAAQIRVAVAQTDVTGVDAGLIAQIRAPELSSQAVTQVVLDANKSGSADAGLVDVQPSLAEEVALQTQGDVPLVVETEAIADSLQPNAPPSQSSPSEEIASDLQSDAAYVIETDAPETDSQLLTTSALAAIQDPMLAGQLVQDEEESSLMGIQSAPKALATLSGHAYLDENQNGQFDAAEQGVVNQPVRLLDRAGTELSRVLTGESGEYRFTDIWPDAQVQLVFPDLTESLPGGELQLTVSDQGLLPVNFAYTAQAQAAATDLPRIELTDSLYQDLNENGEFDEDEPFIANVLVNLYLGETLVDSVRTSAEGRYSFTDLLSGQPYWLEFVYEELTINPMPMTAAGTQVLAPTPAQPKLERLPETGDKSATVTMILGWFILMFLAGVYYQKHQALT